MIGENLILLRKIRRKDGFDDPHQLCGTFAGFSGFCCVIGEDDASVASANDLCSVDGCEIVPFFDGLEVGQILG